MRRFSARSWFAVLKSLPLSLLIVTDSLVTVMLGVCIVGLSGTILKEAAPAAASYLFNSSNLPSSFLPAAHPAAAVYNLPLSSEGSPLINGGLTGIFGEHKKNGTGGSHGGKGGGDEPIPEAIEALFGVFLILFAQLFTASQFVLEEKVSHTRAKSK